MAGVECPANVYAGPDGAGLVEFVISLNEKRRHMDASQRAAVAAELATLTHGGDRQSHDFKASIDALKMTDAEAARLLNVSEPSVERAKAVKRADAELHERVKRGEIKAGNARAELKRRKNAEVTARRVAEPDGKYDCIVIDPPWLVEYGWRDIWPNQVALDYPTMSEEELAAFPLPNWAADDCHLFLWTTHKHLPMALRLAEAWGFKYVCQFVWRKPGGFQLIGLPQYNCEFALYCRKGSPTFVDTKAFPTCFHAPRREHSRKLDEFYDVVRRVTNGQRIDVFSREKRDGFAQFGNEADKFDGGADALAVGAVA